MSQPTLSHLTGLLASPPPIKHSWNVGDDMTAMGNETPALLKSVGSLSFRALIGLQAALNEWVAARFRDQTRDMDFDQVIDATWAASIDHRYLKLDAMEFPDASGLVEGPIRESKVQSRDVLQQIPLAEFGAVRYVIASANLVKYELPAAKPFQDSRVTTPSGAKRELPVDEVGRDAMGVPRLCGHDVPTTSPCS